MFAMRSASSSLPANIHLMTTESDSSLFEPNIKKLWNLETIGIKSKDNQEKDDLVMQMFKNTTTKEDRRYQVSRPWRTQNHNLPENYKLSLGRLKTQMKRFEKDRNLLQRYDEVIKDRLSKVVIEQEKWQQEALYTTPRCY